MAVHHFNTTQGVPKNSRLQCHLPIGMPSDGILHWSDCTWLCCLLCQLISHHQICGGNFQLVYHVTISVHCKNSRGLEGGGCRRRRSRRHCTATAAVLPVLDRGKTIKTTFVTSRQLCRYFSSQLYLQAKQRLLFRCYKKLWLGSWNTIAWVFLT